MLFLQKSYGLVQHAVGKICGGGCPNRPSNNKSVKAINYGRKLYFPGGDTKLCDISKPLCVGCIGMEISIYKVGDSRADLSGIGTIFSTVCVEPLVRLAS